MASFNALPGRNLGTLAALILIDAPVRGLRPIRAARFPTAKVPKPTSDTEPPFFKVNLTAEMVDSSARAATALGMSASDATKSISSVLFTTYLLGKLAFTNFLLQALCYFAQMAFCLSQISSC